MHSPAFSPIDPNLLMVSCDMSGAYISRDGGRRWQMVHHLQLRGNVRCKPGFHPQDVNIIYAVDSHAAGVRFEDDLKVTHDGGAQWSKLAHFRTRLYGAIAFDPDHPELMVVGAADGAFISRDAGHTWEHCAGVSGQGVACFVDRTSPKDVRIMFVATKEGIWRSDDDGGNWTKQEAGLPRRRIVSFAAGADPKTGQVMLYCTVPSELEDEQLTGGVYRSRDRGEHWESAMGHGLNQDTAAADAYAEGPIAQYRHVLTTNTKPLTVCVFNTRTGLYPPHHPTVYRSDDGGENWRATMFADPRFEGCNVQPDWEVVSTGRSPVACPFGAAIADSDPDRVIHLRGRCHITHDGGQHWFAGHALPAPGQELRAGCAWQVNGLMVTTVWHYYFDPFQPNRRYIAYTDIGFAKSLDAGKTWIWWTEDQRTRWHNTCYEIALDPEVPGKMWGAFANLHDLPNYNIISGAHGYDPPGGGSVCRSTDFGDTWRAFGEGLPDEACTSIVLDPRSPQGSRTLYASFFEDGVYKSSDDGRTWVKKSEGLGAPENLRVYRLILHQDGTLFALITAKRQQHQGTGRSQPGPYLEKGVGLYRSTDGGESWECLTKSVGLLWPKDFSVSPATSKVIFIGAADADNDQGGLWRTTDGGATWKRVAREGPEHFGAYFDPRRPDWVYMTLTEDVPGPSLWLSVDGGDSWRPITSFPFANTQRVEFDPEDPNVIYVDTFGSSVLKGTFR